MLHMEKALCVSSSPELTDDRRGLFFVELANKGCTSKGVRPACLGLLARKGVREGLLLADSVEKVGL